MGKYQQILVAVDLSDDSFLVCQKAVEIAQQSQSSIMLIHVLEMLYPIDGTYDPLFYPSFDLAVDDTEMLNMAQKKMDELIKSLSVPDGVALNNQVISGTPKIEVIRIAEEKQVDLIVCGSHGRSGLELLLGSTANAILHHAPCDVLAVQTRKTTE